MCFEKKKFSGYKNLQGVKLIPSPKIGKGIALNKRI